MSQSLRGIIFVLIAAVLWSTGGLFIKRIPLDPLSIVFLRAAIAGISLLPFLQPRHIRLNKYLLGYIFSFCWLVITFVTATKLTSAANAIALQYTAPLYLFIYSVFRREIQLNWRTLTPIALIFLGICSFLLEPSTGSNLIGNLLAISSGVALASMSLFLLQLKETPAISLVSLSNLTTALLVLPFLPEYAIIARINLEGWLSLIYLGTIQIALAYVFFIQGVKQVKPLQATILALTEAILNPVWVVIFIGEVPSIQGLIGAAFILIAVVVDISLKIREQRAIASADHSTSIGG